MGVFPRSRRFLPLPKGEGKDRSRAQCLQIAADRPDIPREHFQICPILRRENRCGNLKRYMKALLLAQLNPTKTLGQLVDDRNLYRILAIFTLIVVWCG